MSISKENGVNAYFSVYHQWIIIYLSLQTLII